MSRQLRRFKPSFFCWWISFRLRILRIWGLADTRGLHPWHRRWTDKRFLNARPKLGLTWGIPKKSGVQRVAFTARRSNTLPCLLKPCEIAEASRSSVAKIKQENPVHVTTMYKVWMSHRVLIIIRWSCEDNNIHLSITCISLFALKQVAKSHCQ